MSRPSTLGQLKQSGYRPRSVKDEIRANAIARLRAGDKLFPGIIGYEFDARATTTSNLSTWASSEPSSTHTVGHSFVPAGDGNATNVYSDSVLWTAPSGATIFSAGTIQRAWGLDNGYLDGYCGCSPGTYVNSATQRITQNVLDRFSGP